MRHRTRAFPWLPGKLRDCRHAQYTEGALRSAGYIGGLRRQAASGTPTRLQAVLRVREPTGTPPVVSREPAPRVTRHTNMRERDPRLNETCEPQLSRRSIRHAIVLTLGACLALLILGACGSDAPPAPDTGIEGLVTLGPMCPVVQPGQDCPDRPYEATLVIRDGDNNGGNEVARVQSDATGRYRITLHPGEYILDPLSPPGMPLPRAEPVDVTVRAGAFTEVNIAYDSGIR